MVFTKLKVTLRYLETSQRAGGRDPCYRLAADPSWFQPGSVVPLLGGDDHDRAVRVVHDLAADRAEQQAGESAGAARAHHDHVSVPAGVDQFLGGDAAERIDGDALRVGVASVRKRLVRCVLRGLAGLHGGRVLLRVGDRARAPVADGPMEDRDHPERYLPYGGLLDGPFKGPLRMSGAVDSDGDSRHCPHLLTLSASAVSGFFCEQATLGGPRDSVAIVVPLGAIGPWRRRTSGSRPSAERGGVNQLFTVLTADLRKPVNRPLIRSVLVSRRGDQGEQPESAPPRLNRSTCDTGTTAGHASHPTGRAGWRRPRGSGGRRQRLHVERFKQSAR